MVYIGVQAQSVPSCELKKLDNGFVIPNVSLENLHQEAKHQIQEQVDISVLADQLGWDYVFQREHHFTLLGSISPNPVLSQAAVASQTENVRLLQIANILPWHEPIRLAEQLAMLDILSAGRVEVGVGVGTNPRETETLGQYWGGTSQNEVENGQSFREKFEILIKCWEQNSISYLGQFHKIPPAYTEYYNRHEYYYLANSVSGTSPEKYMKENMGTNILKSLSIFPQPIQTPHPQLWRPTMSAHSIEWAAKRGINGVCSCDKFNEVKKRIDHYQETAKEANWPDHRDEYNGEPFSRGWDAERCRGLVCIFHIFNTEIASDGAFERWKLGQEFRQSVKKGVLPPEEAENIDIDAETVLENSDTPIVGSTDEIINQIKKFEEICEYENTVIFFYPGVTGMKHEDIIEQIHGFDNQVLPRLKNR